MKKSLHRFLKESSVSSDLILLLLEISRASKGVAHAIRTGDLGEAGTSNLYGEDQMALDVLADTLFCDELQGSATVKAFASEEQDKPILINPEGKYLVAFDPLDGSSLIDVNVTIGSIFGVWEGADFIGKSGNDLVLSGYYTYGPRTTLVVTWGDGVHEFTLNDLGEYQLTRENIRFEGIAKTFSPGNLRAALERPEYASIMQSWMDNQRTLRYAGGMVTDINAILLKGGGIFSYPSHSQYPDGKLRLLYECAPMSHIIEQAGGIALNEKGDRVMDQVVEKIHDRTTIILGTSDEVKDFVIKLLK